MYDFGTQYVYMIIRVPPEGASFALDASSAIIYVAQQVYPTEIYYDARYVVVPGSSRTVYFTGKETTVWYYVMIRITQTISFSGQRSIGVLTSGGKEDYSFTSFSLQFWIKRDQRLTMSLTCLSLHFCSNKSTDYSFSFLQLLLWSPRPLPWAVKERLLSPLDLRELRLLLWWRQPVMLLRWVLRSTINRCNFKIYFKNNALTTNSFLVVQFTHCDAHLYLNQRFPQCHKLPMDDFWNQRNHHPTEHWLS